MRQSLRASSLVNLSWFCLFVGFFFNFCWRAKIFFKSRIWGRITQMFRKNLPTDGQWVLTVCCHHLSSASFHTAFCHVEPIPTAHVTVVLCLFLECWVFLFWLLAILNVEIFHFSIRSFSFWTENFYFHTICYHFLKKKNPFLLNI